jgi:hypothetical protein
MEQQLRLAVELEVVRTLAAEAAAMARASRVTPVEKANLSFVTFPGGMESACPTLPVMK